MILTNVYHLWIITPMQIILDDRQIFFLCYYGIWYKLRAILALKLQHSGITIQEQQRLIAVRVSTLT